MIKPEWVAGLNHGAHDAACALLHHGQLVAFVEEERISRMKRALGQPPVRALKWCLDFAGIALHDLDCVALGSDHSILAKWLGDHTREAQMVLSLQSPDRLFPREVFGTDTAPEVVSFRHHIAHAASAFWPSGFDEAAILVLDAMGEDASALLGFGDNTGISVIRTYDVGVSLGFFYEAATSYAGFEKHQAGKLMGLAPYGTATEPMPLSFDGRRPVWRGIPRIRSRGRALIRDTTEALISFFEGHCFPYERGLREEIMAYAHFAASAQASLEEVVLQLAAEARRETRAGKLAMAGGVALNCTANGRLASAGLFQDLFVQPAAHDAGVALGAAFLAVHQRSSGEVSIEPMKHAYWGPSSDEGEIERCISASGLAYVRLCNRDLAARVARLLADGRIVAWHQGRGEVGPRALGARSLLGDPRRRQTVVRLNNIKGREVWRPVAPSLLAEYFDDYFIGKPNPFMLVAAEVRPHARSKIPAVVHVDGSSRPQVVVATTNPLYALLLTEFHRIAGVPILANTSLNRKQEPISNSVADTLSVVLSGKIDAAAIGPFLVTP